MTSAHTAVRAGRIHLVYWSTGRRTSGMTGGTGGELRSKPVWTKETVEDKEGDPREGYSNIR